MRPDQISSCFWWPFFNYHPQCTDYHPKLTTRTLTCPVKNFFKIWLIALPGGALITYPSKLSPNFFQFSPWRARAHSEAPSYLCGRKWQKFSHHHHLDHQQLRPFRGLGVTNSSRHAVLVAARYSVGPPFWRSAIRGIIVIHCLSIKS